MRIEYLSGYLRELMFNRLNDIQNNFFKFKFLNSQQISIN